jgi:CRISPR/Cas system endoribonuclease Cas6 (RAMP superfamily)
MASEPEKQKSFFRLFIDIVIMLFSWWRKDKQENKIANEAMEQQKLNEFNKISENLENQYNSIDKDKINQNVNDLSIEEINQKLNERLK